VALANGRSRLDLCAHCGTLDLSTPDGLELFSMKGRAHSLMLELDKEEEEY